MVSLSGEFLVFHMSVKNLSSYTTTSKFLQVDWLRVVVFQLSLKYLHVKITNLLRVAV